MKRYEYILATLLTAGCFLYSAAQDATSIVKKADERMRGNTLQSEMIIRTIRPSWSREMQCKTWMKGTVFAMILIQSPAKDKGIVF